jgi:hypothetical protein
MSEQVHSIAAQFAHLYVTDHPDTERVRTLCRDRGIPTELRGKIWQVDEIGLLQISNTLLRFE